ncbi:pyridoxamine 5'-phosphate oxidase [Catenovulum maritimum]|uniref:Pyridoxine/pyridoxamine 5'-phosphate oxidase n=1 Tax=Catenovulum maritimum TaxID=1513271 RepID=A0A0J8JPR4_9ALTE|nr:pyridoxamine 5'-phosphate oxidase [Catenovulum maritimum]KMT66656.1 pyridoxine 5'-phosphate oxidase [Catenovulum maritimum]
MSIFYQVRREYDLTGLSESDLTASPYELFETWLNQVMQIEAIKDPTAMVVATVDSTGMPFQRTVLMKSVDETGFVFYTNKLSRKGQQLAKNPKISAIFPWLAAERQVCITGEVELLSASENEAYFSSRPFESKIAALASKQSQPIENRDILENKYQALLSEYQGKEVACPENWGGYKIIPSSIEFWQGGEYRLHDRFIYTLQQDENSSIEKSELDSNWQVARLQP